MACHALEQYLDFPRKSIAGVPGKICHDDVEPFTRGQRRRLIVQLLYGHRRIQSVGSDVVSRARFSGFGFSERDDASGTFITADHSNHSGAAE